MDTNHNLNGTTDVVMISAIAALSLLVCALLVCLHTRTQAADVLHDLNLMRQELKSELHELRDDQNRFFKTDFEQWREVNPDWKQPDDDVEK